MNTSKNYQAHLEELKNSRRASDKLAFAVLTGTNEKAYDLLNSAGNVHMIWELCIR